MEVRLPLGPLSATDDRDHELALGGAKQRSLLAMLAVEANTGLSVDMLAEGVWGERVPERYIQNIQVYVRPFARSWNPTACPRCRAGSAPKASATKSFWHR